MLIAVQLERRYTKDRDPGTVPEHGRRGADGLRHRGRGADVLLQARQRAHPFRGGAAGRHPEGPLGVQPLHQPGGRPGAPGDRARPHGGAGLPGRRRGRAAEARGPRDQARGDHARHGHLHRRLVRRLRHPDPHRSGGGGQVQPDHVQPRRPVPEGAAHLHGPGPREAADRQEKLWEIMPAATVEYSGSEDTEVPEAPWW